MINSEVFYNIECNFCHKGALGTKKIYSLATDEWEEGWYGCLNCLHHIHVKPIEEKRRA